MEDVGLAKPTAPADSFWRGRRVFVTGHTGFKGSWLSTWLLAAGAEVTGYALPPNGNPSLFDVIGLASQLDHVIGDVRDLRELSAAMQAAQPEVVIHMAAQPLVRESYRDPVSTYTTNVLGTVHVLEAARVLDRLRVVLVVTSDKCYENREWEWGYRENDRLGGRDPYSNSKACAELVVAAYRESFFPTDRASEHGVAVVTARAGNMIGGGDWTAHRLVPDAMKAFSVRQPLRLRHPGATRPWQHVIDPLHGYLRLCQVAYDDPVRASGAFNFGPAEDDVASVAALAGLLAKAWGQGAAWEIESESPELHEATHLKLDCSRAREELGWRPVFGIERAVRETVGWYREFYEHAGPARLRQLMLDQIPARG